MKPPSDNYALIVTKTSASSEEQCRECKKEFSTKVLEVDIEKNFKLMWYRCPYCHTPNILLVATVRDASPVYNWVHPPRRVQAKSFPNCPAEVRCDYQDAVAIKHISPRAAGYLATRALGKILYGLGYRKYELKQQIEALRRDTNRRIPDYLASSLYELDELAEAAPQGREPEMGADAALHHDSVNMQIDFSLHVLEEVIEFQYEKPAQDVAFRKSMKDKIERLRRGESGCGSIYDEMYFDTSAR